MTTPDEIWAIPGYEPGWLQIWTNSREGCTRYIRADPVIAELNRAYRLIEVLRSDGVEITDTPQTKELRAEIAELREQLRSMREIAQGRGPFCERCGRGEPGPNLVVLPPLPNEVKS